MPHPPQFSAPAKWIRPAAWAAGLVLLALAGCAQTAGVTPTPSPTQPATSTPVPTATPGPPTATVAPSATATLAPTATLGRGSVRAAAIDSMQQVYVPAGEFSMGSAGGDGLAYDDELPQHAVLVSAFWMDRTEVTNAHFAAFVTATGYDTMAERTGEGLVFQPAAGAWEAMRGADWQHPTGPAATIAGMDNYPVGQMSWSDAVAYCAWAGRRLPTEAEWEKAARGVDRRPYPWGDDPAGGRLLNFADRHMPVAWADAAVDDGYMFFAPVGTYPAGASPYGALDMAGNAWEWAADFFDDRYYARSPYADPGGPETGVEHVLRGGSWWTSARDARTTARGEASDFPYDIYGFRCAEPAG